MKAPGFGALKVKIPDNTLIRPWNGIRDLYSETNSICASAMRCCPLKPKMRSKRHVYGLESPALSTLVAFVLTYPFVKIEPRSVLIIIKWHEIANSRRSNRTLLFVTVKGTENGEPDDGGAAENVGSVGQNGPHTCEIFAAKARMPSASAARPTKTIRTRMCGDGWSNRRNRLWSGDGVC